MENEFLEFVADVMGVESSELSLSTAYGAFDKWDSLMMLTLTMELEEKYNASIPIEKLEQIKTLEDLYLAVR